MRTLLRLVASLCLSAVASLPAPAQITITSANVSATLSPGITITSRVDTATKTIDIGSPGATSWDFTMLNSNITASAMCVLPDTTPFISYFPGSTIVQRVSVPAAGTLYSYMQLGTDLLLRGSGVTGTFQQRITEVPDEIVYKLPMTLGTSWKTEYVESTLVTLPSPFPPQVTVTAHSVSNAVDAYGSLTLPGGGTYQALRVKTDSRITTATYTSRSIWYTILAGNGASAVVFAADTLQPDNGVIKVSNISRTNPLLTDVAARESAPTEFSLNQNYPNPFNPSTVVRYQLPTVSDVRLVVYNLLGQEIKVLVNEQKPPGSYEVTFDGKDLASGVYFYRLEAGAFRETKKFVLQR